MDYQNVIVGKNIVKKYKDFTLEVPEFKLPKGFATALIGENGAGKTTLLNILAGIKLDYTGELTFFGKYNDVDREKDPYVREHIGYTGTEGYYFPSWTIGQIEELSGLIFNTFDKQKFEKYGSELAIFNHTQGKDKKISSLSDGNKTKLMLAGVLARQTSVLLLDEPASPLDPLMREKLCDMIRDYLSGDPERSVLFSTHNISDMEDVTDYAIIVEQGRIVEEGFVDDLKEKYIYVKGEPSDTEMASKILFSITKSKYGFEGICLSKDLDKLAGMDIITEVPSLHKISVAVMKKTTKLL